MKCYLSEKYNIDHTGVAETFLNRFVTVGKMFEGNPICLDCYLQLMVIAEAYGNSQITNIRGNVTNMDVKVSLDEMIERSKLKDVIKGLDLHELLIELTRYLHEVNPSPTYRNPSIEQEMARIDGKRFVR